VRSAAGLMGGILGRVVLATASSHGRANVGYHGSQLKLHALRTREVARDSSDLLKLAHALAAEAELMIHREKK